MRMYDAAAYCKGCFSGLAPVPKIRRSSGAHKTSVNGPGQWTCPLWSRELLQSVNGGKNKGNE
jgi:hypothetical protein